MLYFFFFFKQKTAYEMCGRDWSSDVCSSDLFQHFVIMLCCSLIDIEMRSWLCFHAPIVAPQSPIVTRFFDNALHDLPHTKRPLVVTGSNTTIHHSPNYTMVSLGRLGSSHISCCLVSAEPQSKLYNLQVHKVRPLGCLLILLHSCRLLGHIVS